MLMNWIFKNFTRMTVPGYSNDEGLREMKCLVTEKVLSF